MSRRHYSSVAVPTTTASSLDATITALTVTALTGYPATPFTAVLEPDTSNEEVVEVTNVSGTSLTITRGIDGSSGRSHLTGVAFEHRVSAREFDEPNAHLNATSGVHGVTGAVVGTTDVQAVTNKDLSSSTNTFPSSGAWTSFSPAFTNVTSGAGSFAYKQVGKILFVRGRFTGGTATGAANIAVTLPGGLSAAEVQPVSAFSAASLVYAQASTTVLVICKDAAGSAWSAGNSLNGVMFSAAIEVA